eukprot:Pgem_evm1s10114
MVIKSPAIDISLQKHNGLDSLFYSDVGDDDDDFDAIYCFFCRETLVSFKGICHGCSYQHKGDW